MAGLEVGGTAVNVESRNVSAFVWPSDQRGHLLPLREAGGNDGGDLIHPRLCPLPKHVPNRLLSLLTPSW